LTLYLPRPKQQLRRGIPGFPQELEHCSNDTSHTKRQEQHGEDAVATFKAMRDDDDRQNDACQDRKCDGRSVSRNQSSVYVPSGCSEHKTQEVSKLRWIVIMQVFLNRVNA
jgi:hypothetical protein